MESSIRSRVCGAHWRDRDERSRIYADILRLQNMKIDAMTEEIARLHKG
jgi:hypothetical protein